MKDKRTVLSDAMLRQAEEAKAETGRTPIGLKTRGKPENDYYKMTFRIPRKTARHMQEIAHARSTTLQDTSRDADCAPTFFDASNGR